MAALEEFKGSHMIKTTFAIFSDNLGMDRGLPQYLLENRVDVAVYCGNLTDCSTIKELKASLRLLKEIDAGLKLVIAGNHDLILDGAAFTAHINATGQSIGDEDVLMQYGGGPQEARQAVEDFHVGHFGIEFLDEGTHNFELENGAILKVFASPWTPKSAGPGAFQYSREEGHEFPIEEATNLVITNGPPRGILDRNVEIGCPDLFTAIARARPQIHAFGQHREGWGAYMARWNRKRLQTLEEPGSTTAIRHTNAINMWKSELVQNLARLKPFTLDTPEAAAERVKRFAKWDEDGCCVTKHTFDDSKPLYRGDETLFVNGAVTGRDGQRQMPWIVDIELSKIGTLPASLYRYDDTIRSFMQNYWPFIGDITQKPRNTLQALHDAAEKFRINRNTLIRPPEFANHHKARLSTVEYDFIKRAEQKWMYREWFRGTMNRGARKWYSRHRRERRWRFNVKYAVKRRRLIMRPTYRVARDLRQLRSVQDRDGSSTESGSIAEASTASESPESEIPASRSPASGSTGSTSSTESESFEEMEFEEMEVEDDSSVSSGSTTSWESRSSSPEILEEEEPIMTLRNRVVYAPRPA